MLQSVLMSIGDHAMADAIAPMARGETPGPNVLGRLVREYTGVLNEVFALRAEAFVQLYLCEGLGFKDFWYRVEFAKLRGQAHLHGLLWHTKVSKVIANVLKGATSKDDMDSVREFEQTAAPKLAAALASAGLHVTATHAGGRQRAGAGQESMYARNRLKANRGVAADGDESGKRMSKTQRALFVDGADVHAADVGNFDVWTAPEGPPHGVYASASYKPLRSKTFELFDAEAEHADAIHYDNRCCLHTCTKSYCLGDKGATRRAPSERGGTVVCLECRFGFGEEGGVGKPARARPSLETDERGVTKLEPERDHPRKNAGDEHVARTWGVTLGGSSHLCLRALVRVPAPCTCAVVGMLAQRVQQLVSWSVCVRLSRPLFGTPRCEYGYPAYTLAVHL